MGPNHPVRSVDEDEVELGKHPVGAEPDVVVATLINGGNDLAAKLPADCGVGPVGADDQVGTIQRGEVGDRGTEFDRHSQCLGPLGQDLEKPLAAHRREPMAAGHELPATRVVDPDLPPAAKAGHKGGVALAVGGLEVVECLVAEDHAEPVGVSRLISLQDADPVPGPLLGEENRQVEAGRPAADDECLQTVPAHLDPMEPTLGGMAPVDAPGEELSGSEFEGPEEVVPP